MWSVILSFYQNLSSWPLGIKIVRITKKIVFRIFSLAISMCARKSSDHEKDFFEFRDSKFVCAQKFSSFRGKYYVLVQTFLWPLGVKSHQIKKKIHFSESEGQNYYFYKK